MIAQLHEVLQLERPLIGIDLETTGVNAQTSGICELALEIMKPGEPVKEYRTLVNPMMPIPDGATTVHGITNAMVQGAPTFKILAPMLIRGLVECDYAGYNLWFDLRQMMEEFKRCGEGYDHWSYEGAGVLDGFRLWQIAEQRTLSHAVERWLGATNRDEKGCYVDPAIESLRDGTAHNALWDIKMSTRIIAAQVKANPAWPTTVRGLHELQWPDRFDAEGKLRWNKDGELCFTFGEHREKPLRTVPRQYLNWVLGKDFSALVKNTVRNALRGAYPAPPVRVPADELD